MNEDIHNGSGGAHARRILTGISSRAWEHPADRAALAALRRLPVFDLVLKKLFGIFGEKPVRLSFQANAVRVTPRQFPHVHRLYLEVCETLDAPEPYDLFISQTPVVNAGAYGMDRPFIILNSGMKTLLNDRQLQYVMGHEVGHIMSGHVLYRTMTVLLLQLAQLGFPIVGIAARAVLIGLLEWSRKAELSCDRAGLLAIQDPDDVMIALMRMAGAGTPEETNLGEFIQQAEEYRTSEDVADSVFKILNLLGQSHPFPVLRVAELRTWIEDGHYERVLAGQYARRGEPDPEYRSDLREAARAYAEGARGLLDDVADAARKMGESLFDNLRR